MVAAIVALSAWSTALEIDRHGESGRFRSRLDLNDDGTVDQRDELFSRRVARGFGVVSALGVAVGVAGTLLFAKRLRRARELGRAGFALDASVSSRSLTLALRRGFCDAGFAHARARHAERARVAVYACAGAHDRVGLSEARLLRICAIMNLTETIFARRSVRSYRPEPVAARLVVSLLESAVHAPSAMNKQPWLFAVVQDAARLKRWSDMAKERLLRGAKDDAELARHTSILRDESFNIF
ncbi:MAG TPA: nitroreductase family protein, partial [Polyangiales bacterium]|nr:nitroreductase family protein [Polyangiales bacterium]